MAKNAFVAEVTFKQFTMFLTPESQLISLTFNSSTDAQAFPSSVRSTSGRCFLMSLSVNIYQILISFNHASYDVFFSKDGGPLKFDAIDGP